MPYLSGNVQHRLKSESSKKNDKNNDNKDGDTICLSVYNHQHNHRHVLSDEDYENPCPICLSGYKGEEEITINNKYKNLQ